MKVRWGKMYRVVIHQEVMYREAVCREGLLGRSRRETMPEYFSGDFW